MKTNLTPTEKEQADIVIISNLHDGIKALTKYAQATDSGIYANGLTENSHSLIEKLDAYNDRQDITFNGYLKATAAIIAEISKGIAHGIHWALIFQKARGSANLALYDDNPETQVTNAGVVMIGYAGDTAQPSRSKKQGQLADLIERLGGAI